MLNKYLWLNADKVIKLMSQFLLSVLLARFVSTDNFGMYFYGLSVSVLVMEISVLGLQTLVTSKLIKTPEKTQVILATSHTLRVGAGIVITLLTLLVMTCFEDNSITLLTFVFCLSACFRSGEVFESYAQSIGKPEFPAKVRVLIFCLSLPIKIAVIYFLKDVIILSIVILIESILIYILIRRIIVIDCSRNFVKEDAWDLLNAGKFLLLSSISAIAYLKLDSIMIKNILGLTDVAYYNVGSTLVQSAWFLAINYCVLYFPSIHRSENKEALFKKHYLRLMYIGIGLTIVIIPTSDFFIISFFGKDYQSSIFISQIYSLILPIYFFRALLSKWIIISGNYKYSLISHLMGLLTNIVLNVILIDKYGSLGAAISTVLSFFASTFLFILLFSKPRKHIISTVKA